MRWIKAKMELRKAGAQGVFTTVTCVTQASTLDLAKEYLIDDARAYGFEPGVILSLTEITKEEYESCLPMGDILNA
jgi:hypothetical protein